MNKLILGLALTALLAISLPTTASANPKEVTAMTLAPGARISTLDQKAIFKLFTEFAKTFSAHDFNAHFALYHFPIARINGPQMTCYQSLSDVPKDILIQGLPADYARSEWTSLTIVQASPTKAHVIATFDRVRKDGTAIGNFPALYIVEKINGVWGVTVRSNFVD
jgi:hypothetical protein